MAVTVLLVIALLLQQPETLSLLGEPLYAPSISKNARARAETELATARAAYDKEPAVPANVIALEQASLALGRVGDALEILTRGIETNPGDARLLLERGRSFIRIRKFDVAERDLRKAVETLPETHCDLGLVLYLSGNFARAREEYDRCPSAGIFSYLARRRAGSSAIPAVPAPADPLESAYLAALDDADRLKHILAKNRNAWMEPAYIAAEADYARLKKAGKKKKVRTGPNARAPVSRSTGCASGRCR
jgi:tetratricopeptide (TPR) repeat protein